MLISAEWYLCDDGVTRPIVRGEVLTADRSWVKAPFLVDTGADRTVLSCDVLAGLGSIAVAEATQLAGIGGSVNSLVVETHIRLTARDGKVAFRGAYAAVAEPLLLDMSVLGRDITGLFAVIVDRPGDIVCLISQQHRYRIEQG